MNLHQHLTFAVLHSRGVALQALGRVAGDRLVAFRGQQDLLRAKLIRNSRDDSYLGPGRRPPVRKSAAALPSRLRLVVSA